MNMKTTDPRIRLFREAQKRSKGAPTNYQCFGLHESGTVHYATGHMAFFETEQDAKDELESADLKRLQARPDQPLPPYARLIDRVPAHHNAARVEIPRELIKLLGAFKRPTPPVIGVARTDSPVYVDIFPDVIKVTDPRDSAAGLALEYSMATGVPHAVSFNIWEFLIAKPSAFIVDPTDILIPARVVGSYDKTVDSFGVVLMTQAAKPDDRF